MNLQHALQFLLRDSGPTDPTATHAQHQRARAQTRVRRFLARLDQRAACAWHRRAEPIDSANPPGCQGCGCLLNTNPYVTSGGDLYCSRCGRIQDEADEGFDFSP